MGQVQERQSLMHLLAQLYQEHTDQGLSDHEPMTDPLCAVCENLRLVTKELEELEESPKKDGEQLVDSKRLTQIFKITTDHGTWLVSAVSRNDARQFFMLGDIYIQSIKLIDEQLYSKIQIQEDEDTYITLQMLMDDLGNVRGILAKEDILRASLFRGRQAHLKKTIDLIRCDFKHLSDFQQFIAPLEMHKSKKKDKINFNTKYGMMAVANGEFLVRLFGNHYVKLNAQEVEESFDLTGQKGWRTID